MEGEQIAVVARPTVGGVLGDTFRLFFGHFLQFGAVAAIGMSPAVVVRYARLFTGLAPAYGPDQPWSLVALSGLADTTINLLLTQMVSGALVYAVFQAQRGSAVRVGDCLAVGAKNLWRLLLVGFLATALVVVGLLLCVVPGLIFLAALSLAVPVTVVERLGARRSLERSRDLTAGHRWTIFAVFMLLEVLAVAVTLLLERLLGGARGVLFQAVSPLSAIFIGGLGSTAAGVLYYRVRSAKGGFDVEEIAAVFE